MATIRVQHASNPIVPDSERRHRRKSDPEPVVIHDRRQSDTETVIVEDQAPTVVVSPEASSRIPAEWKQAVHIALAVVLLIVTLGIVKAFTRPSRAVQSPVYVVPTGGTTYQQPAPQTNDIIVPYPAGSNDPAAPFPIPRLPFSDVPESHPAYREIYALYQKGVLAGYETGAFRPDAPVSRAEVARMLALATDATTVIPGSTYTDMNPPTPGVTPEIYESFTPYVYTATSRGWMQPVSPTMFAPWDDASTRDATNGIVAATGRGTRSDVSTPITRADFCRELARAIGLV